MLNDFQKGIRSVVFQPFDGHGCIEESDAFLVKKSHDFIFFEAFMLCINEMAAVTKPDLALDTPVVVDEVGVEKVHAPTLLWRRETAQEKHLGI